MNTTNETMPRVRSAGVGPARAANLALAFILEVAALVALGYWGFHTGHTVLADLALGIGAPLVAAIVWGAFAAPRALRRLAGRALVALKLTVLWAGAAALAMADQPLLAAVLAVAVLANTVLLQVWGQESAQP